jgi:quercetin dioxygenase-like cupin family protein
MRSAPIIVPAREGERRTLLGDIIITTVGAAQTDGQFSLIGNAGPRAPRPIPMHFHEHEHEMFVPLRGSMQIWSDGASRILHPGDFASVPAGVHHAYHFLDRHNQFLGYAMPGGFEGMFRITGEPTDAYVHPAAGATGPPPFERFERARAEGYVTMVDTPYVGATEGTDDALPGSCTPYFLRAGEGRRLLALDQLFTVMMGAAETDGKAAIFHAQGPKGAGFPPVTDPTRSFGIWVLDGVLALTLDGVAHSLVPGDFAYAPADCVWSYVMGSHFTQIHVISTPAGFEELLAGAGTPYEHYVFPGNELTPGIPAALRETAERLAIRIGLS